MKKLLTSLAAVLALTLTGWAQTSNTNLNSAIDLFSGATNFFAGFAPVYSAHLRNDKGELSHWGVTGFVGTPVSDNVNAIIRADYLDERVFLVNGTMTIGREFKTFKGLPNVRLWAIVGAGTIAYGAGKGDGEAYGITGAGLSIKAFRALKADWYVGGDYEHWIGPKNFDSWRPGIAAQWSF